MRGVTTKNFKMAALAKISKEQFVKENYPDLSKHNNIMASNLTFEVSRLFFSLVKSMEWKTTMGSPAQNSKFQGAVENS